jgi:hypothetical protein
MRGRRANQDGGEQGRCEKRKWPGDVVHDTPCHGNSGAPVEGADAGVVDWEALLGPNSSIPPA